MAAQQNLKITRGDDVYYILTFTDANSLPIDITGWIVFFTVKENLADSDNEAKIRKDITTHTDAVNGKTRIHLTNTDTKLSKNHYYDVQVKKPDGSILTLLIGSINFKKDVTQRTS